MEVKWGINLGWLYDCVRLYVIGTANTILLGHTHTMHILAFCIGLYKDSSDHFMFISLFSIHLLIIKHLLVNPISHGGASEAPPSAFLRLLRNRDS